MNTYDVLVSLKNLLETHLTNFPFQTSEKGQRERGSDGENSTRDVSVYIGSLPARSGDFSDLVPFVVIQPLNGYDSEGRHIIDIGFRLCVKNRDSEALEHDLHNLIAHVRHSLFLMKEKPLEARITLFESEKGALPWERPDEQENNYLQAYILGTFSVVGNQ